MSIERRLAAMQAQAAQKREAERARKLAEWKRIQAAMPEFAEFVATMRRDDPTTRLLHTEIGGQVIQTTERYADLERGRIAGEKRAAQLMAVECIR